MSQPACYRHEGTEAIDTCSACLQPICSLCSIVRGSRILCPPCAKKARTCGLIVKLVVLVIILGSVGALGFYLVMQEPPFDYGKHTAKIEKLKGQLENEPCDRSKIIELGDSMYAAGDYRGVLNRAQRFYKECGEYLRLRWITYESYKEISEYRAAIREATLLIDDNPDDQDFWWWRGIAHEQLGELDQAARDYRQAIGVEPRLSGIPFNLASVLEKLNRPCEALFPVEQYLHYHPEQRNAPRIQRRLDRLRSVGNCDELAGEGKAEIMFQPHASIIQTFATVNNTKGSFILDTGSTYVALSGAFARKADINMDGKPEILVQTASGIHTARLSMAAKLQLQALVSRRVPVVIIQGDDLGPGVDGLLGLSFLSRYTVQIDQQQGKAVIESR